MTTKCCGLFWAATLLLPVRSISQTSVPFIPFGLQSGTDLEKESSYVASMAYNDENREVIITGGTYGNYFQHSGSSSMADSETSIQDADCFLAMFRLPSSQDSRSNVDEGKFEWIRRRQFGNSATEFCSGIEAGASGMYVIGHSDESGILSSLLPYGSRHRSVYGMVLDLNDNIELTGGRLQHSSELQYPVQLASDPNSQDLFVATIFSDAQPANVLRESPTNSRIYRGGQDIASTGYRTPAYGKKFSVRLERMKAKNPENFTSGNSNGVNDLAETIEPTWTREFGTQNLDTVQVSGLLYFSSTTLVMAGYTRGSGPSFGYADNSDDSDLDGFITKINPESGNLMATKRIKTQSDDRVIGICHQKGANDSTAVFVVGMTNGFFDKTYLPHNYDYNEGTNFAFLIKLDLETMEILWSRQLGAVTTDKSQIDHTPQVHGMSCTVTSDGDDVWMAGAVKNGDALSIYGEPSFVSGGGDDIFVAQFRTADGFLNFARQIGTSEDDYLAQGNSLDTDGDGNLIVLGNTRGSLFREKANFGVSDVFALSVGRASGDFVPSIEITGAKKGSMSDERDTTGGSRNGLVDISQSNQAGLKQAHALVSVGVLVGLLFLLVGLALILERIRRREASKGPIETECDAFDAVDMVLEARTMKGWQTLVANAARGHPAIEGKFRRNPFYDEGSKNMGLPWETVTFDESSFSSSLELEESRHLEESRSVVFSSSSLTVQGGDGYKSRSTRDPLLSDGGTAQDDPYEEIYDLLNEASQRLAPKSKPGHASRRYDMLNQASERMSQKNGSTQKGKTKSRRIVQSISKDEYSIDSFDDIWGREII